MMISLLETALLLWSLKLPIIKVIQLMDFILVSLNFMRVCNETVKDI